MTLMEDKRKSIAETDREIIALLKKRTELAKEVAENAAGQGMRVSGSENESRMVARYRLLADENGFDPDKAEAIARELSIGAVGRERRVASDDSAPSEVTDGAPTPMSTEDRRNSARRLLLVGILMGALVTVLTVVAAVGYSETLTVIGMMAVPIMFIILSFYLSYSDILKRECSKNTVEYLSRRAYIFGGILTAISLLIVALFMLK